MNIWLLIMQSELENLAFMYTNAEDYARVQRRIAELYKEHEKELEEVPIPHFSEIWLLENLSHPTIHTATCNFYL